MKYISKIIIITIIITTTLICKENLNKTLAYPYTIKNTTLFYEEDNIKLSENIKLYLEDIDDLLIPNTSFNYSEILTDNYDFLIHFATDYILKHQEIYSNQIVMLELHKYMTKDGYQEQTDKYIAIDEIYKITDKYFGVTNFEIINDNINIIDNKISLIDYENSYFELPINEVVVEKSNETVKAKVYYDNNSCHLYTFENINNVLKIKNIEVLSWKKQ